MDITLNDPIWTIEHFAAAVYLSVDAAREYTYQPGFPAPRAGFKRNLWTRAEILAWFEALPGRPASEPAPPRRLTTATVVRRANPAAGPGTAQAPSVAPPSTAAQSRPKRSYTPRPKKGAA